MAATIQKLKNGALVAPPVESATALQGAQEALASAESKIAELVARRRVELLAGADDAVLDETDAEIQALRRAADRGADRVRVLTEQADREAAAAVIRRRDARIAEFADVLAASDVLAQKLSSHMVEAVGLFRALIDKRATAHRMWPLGDVETNSLPYTPEGIALSAGAIRRLLELEIYRLGAPEPLLGGRPGETREVGFPGGVSPDVLRQPSPTTLRPLFEVLREKDEYAIGLMQSGRLEPLAAMAPPVVEQAVEPEPDRAAAPPPEPVAVAVERPVDPAIEAGVTALANALTGRPRTPAEIKLSGLLRTQMQLAAQSGTQAERAYTAIMEKIAIAEAEVSEEKPHVHA